jgi:Tol biopolymer transport system component
VSGAVLADQALEDDYAFSPDSTRIGFRLDRGIRGVTELFALSVAGGPLLSVNPPLSTGRRIAAFGWSADGTRLAYVADEDIAGQFELYTIIATGGFIDTRVSGRMLPDSDVYELAWSPLSSQ